MKAKQQHSTPGDIERKTSEGRLPNTSVMLLSANRCRCN
jgi:hypothetical protein